MKKERRRFGDRRDGKILRDIDAMHFIMPIIYPNRCDNEAYISETIDLTELNAFLARKNADEQDFPYTMFHLIVTALIKTITLRPKLNRFICNKNTYQRNEVTASFVVKKHFEDDSEEGLAFIHAKDNDTLDSLHEAIRKQIMLGRADQINDSTSDSMDILNKMPRFLSKFLIWIITKLDKHGICPQFLIEADPFYSSVVLSNIGSIKMKCGYHHLTNWGTNSLFCIIGEKKLTPVFDAEGNYQMREMVDLGLTIDERLADGYYYSKSIRLLKTLLEKPELLELPMNERVDY